MTANRLHSKLAILGWLALSIPACEGAKDQDATPLFDILQVLPASGSLEVGETASVGAQRLKGGVATNVTSSATWTSADESVVTVTYSMDDGAVVTAVGPGTALIKAVGEDGKSATSEFVVIADIASVEADKGVFELAKGSTRTLGATLLATDGTKREVDEATWGTSKPSVATVDDTGLVTGVAAGDATITITRKGATASQLVHVRDWALEKVTAVARAGVKLPFEQSSPIRVTATFADDHTQNVTALFTFSSEKPTDMKQPDGTTKSVDPAVTNTGSTAVAGKTAGKATISGKGKAGTIVADQTFEIEFEVVDAPLKSLALELPESISTKGEILTPTITGTYGADDLEFDTTATLTGDPADVVYIDNANGTITGLKAGTVAITASVTLDDGDDTTKDDPVIDVKGSLDVIDDDISSLAVDVASADDTATVEVGGTTSLAATATFGANDDEDVTDPAVWSSSDETIAVVSNVAGGTVTGVKLGTATITAKYKGKSATFDVTVADTAPTSAARL